MNWALSNELLTTMRDRAGLAEGWQLDEIVLGHGLEMAPGFAPGGEAANDHKRMKSLFLQ